MNHFLITFFILSCAFKLQNMRLLWKPELNQIGESNLVLFQKWLHQNLGVETKSYHELWEWSVKNHETFWRSVYNYFNVIDHGSYNSVTNGMVMPDTRWFEGSKINYAEHVFRQKSDARPAVLYSSERDTTPVSMSWAELERQVQALQAFLISAGIKKGDRVVAFLPNIPEATVTMLATISLGAVWSSCSPDFGVSSVIDRFQQIHPKVFIAADGYTYNGKRFDKMDDIREISRQMPSLEKTIIVPFLKDTDLTDFHDCVIWPDILDRQILPGEIIFEPVDFNDPIWILYSSGTTGKPKAITHSHGGMLLEHLKYLSFHNDVKPGELFFWYSTTGWMMWNFVHASLLVGATIVLYEGSPVYPDIKALWRMADLSGIHHFGTSAPFIVACMKAGVNIREEFSLAHLRSIGSTGSPLPPEGFDYVYEKISSSVWLTSMSGGTDVCTAFVGGNITLPVYEGQIQCKTLGCALDVYDEKGNPVDVNIVGEMVITKPMPCMPVFFWNDPEKNTYKDSYFTMYEGIWRHGDWIMKTGEDGIIILGRSDATLNRHGVRIGTAEIYGSLTKIAEIKDALVVNLELEGGRHYMPLFVVLQDNVTLDNALVQKIGKQLKTDYSPRHVPDEVFQVNDLPYTISGKKMETPVKKMLLGMPVDTVSNKDAMRNPESLEYFKTFKIPGL